MTFFRSLLLTALVLSSGAVSVQAQDVNELTAKDVKPAFQIEPVVQRVAGRRGTPLEFEFKITSLLRSTNVGIRAVSMTQDETGAILTDVDSPAPNEIQLQTPENIKLIDGKESVIKGTIRLPTTNTPFLVYGVLVTDFGQDLANGPAEAAGGASVGIQFITRYLLRIEVDVEGVRPTDAGKLTIEEPQLREVNGYPQVDLFVVNNTESPIEFQLDCRLSSLADPTQSKSFPLGMPVRVNLPAPEKHVARILPGARVRMQEFVPHAVFPGQTTLDVSIISNRRTWKTASFPLMVEENMFPGQGAAVTAIAPGISASPAQLELSMQSGGARYVSVSLTNSSKDPVTFELQPRELDGTPASWFAIRPESCTVQPGGNRKVLVTLGTERSATEDMYGRLAIEAKSPVGDSVGSSSVAVALISRGEGEAKLEVGELGWGEERGASAVMLPVTNTGDRQAALDARMVMTHIESSKRTTYSAGYGKWLLPTDQTTLKFRMPNKLPGGRYELKILLRTAPDAPLMQLSTLVEISD